MKEIKYFKNLNALRFFAAFLVIIYHTHESVTIKLGYTDAVNWKIFYRGKEAVDFFFTLSGFLITYLILQEVKKTKTVNIRAFYVRRVLRIWPLYLLITSIGFISLGYILPKITGQAYFNFPNIIYGLAFYLLFIPNIGGWIYKVGFMFPLWSIGVEEQFYILWAPLCKVFKNKIIIPAVILFLLGIIFQLLATHFPYPTNAILNTLKFHRMAIGALSAYVLFNTNISSYLNNRFLQILICGLGLFNLFSGFAVGNQIISETFFSAVYGLMIIVLGTAENSIINLENKLFSFLGTISYGIYLWHMMFEWCLRTIVGSKVPHTVNSNLMLFLYSALLLATTIMIASISYKYYEMPFNRLKAKFSPIHNKVIPDKKN